MCLASTPPNLVEVVVRGRFLVLQRIASTLTNFTRSSFGKGFEIGTLASIPPVLVEAVARRTFYFGVFGE